MKRVLFVLALVVCLAGAILIWHYTHRPVTPIAASGGDEHSPTQNVGDFDQFQNDLATRVSKQLGGGGDFSVIVAIAAYPVGTLLGSVGSVPANLEDCLPGIEPKPFAAQHLFPSYTMSSETAFSANLGSGILQGVDNAGLNLKQSANVQYTITDTQIQILDDKYVQEAARQGKCGTYISSHPGTRMIRGTVLGKMAFTVKVDNPAAAKLRLSNLGAFTVKDNPGSSTVTIADTESQPIVELLSQFGNGQNWTTSTSRPQPVVQNPAITPTQPGAAHIYVQMDKQDNPASGSKIVQLVTTAWPSAKVESKVQLIPTARMPNIAQVRYFNESDIDKANRCVKIIQQIYPDARVVRIGLPSPSGQLEVWLPKVGTS
jgi:hypothetical protein